MTEPPPSGARRPVREPSDSAEEVIPGAHLEPDLVLETPSVGDSEESQYARYIEEDQEPVDPEQTLDAEAQEAGAAEPATPADRGPLDLARDARYRATGKRKTSVARVILRPGSGIYTLNGRLLEEFFPRPALQKRAQEALEVVGYASRMDVVARLHGGGVSSQAGALRHGIARALVEADPNLRTDLKRRGFLTRDAREKERRKAGLKKARKRPQFSKR
jgi:small subunit ribosomal protein S9